MGSLSLGDKEAEEDHVLGSCSGMAMASADYCDGYLDSPVPEPFNALEHFIIN